jgi:putative effector of murein hydrolase
MADFVQLWVYLSSTPLFGLTATLLVYVIAQAFYGRMGQAAWANPVLWSVLVLALGLTLTGTAYPTYFSGAQFIHFLLGPAVVALAWPLGLPHEVLLSMAPKSVTAPVAMGVAEKLGGIPALAAVFAVVTGMVGALSGKYLFDALRIGRDAQGWMARGFALGTAAHGIGAARALQVNADAGAWAALALGLQVVFASVLIPLAARMLW